MNEPEQWIVVRNWDRFQHYKNRQPPWIKNYTELLASHNYLSLSLRHRGILHGIWIAYAASGRELGASPAELGRMLGSTSVRVRDLKRLEQAGFIELLLAPRAYTREAEAEKERTTYERTLDQWSYPQVGDEELFELDEKIKGALKEMP